MARYMEPSAEAIATFEDLLERMSGKAREIARCLDPWSLYRYEGYPHRWSLVLVSDRNTGDVIPAFGITGMFNAVEYERVLFMNVEGFDLTKVLPAELPAPDEIVGSLNIPFIIKGYEEVTEGAKEIR